jgi:hypothetical protein
MSEKKQSEETVAAELLPPRELMSLIDPAGLPGTSGVLGATGAAGPDPSQAAQAATPAHGLSDDALHQAQTAPGTSEPHVESTATS